LIWINRSQLATRHPPRDLAPPPSRVFLNDHWVVALWCDQYLGLRSADRFSAATQNGYLEVVPFSLASKAGMNASTSKAGSRRCTWRRQIATCRGFGPCCGIRWFT